jgi:hypothetical protein
MIKPYRHNRDHRENDSHHALSLAPSTTADVIGAAAHRRRAGSVGSTTGRVREAAGDQYGIGLMIATLAAIPLDLHAICPLRSLTP